MNKFPMLKRIGIKIDHKLVKSFDQVELVESFTVSAAELELILQNSQKLYFQRTDNGFDYFNTNKLRGSTFSGILLAPTEMFVQCEKHEPEDDNAEVTHCKRCDVKMNLVKKYVTEE